MSVRETCQKYYSATNWKHGLFDIINALKEEKHPDYEKFSIVAYTLTMIDEPGYWHWLDWSIKKLGEDPQALLNPIPNVESYANMSGRNLLEKYEANDPNYPQDEILREFNSRFANLIKDNEYLSVDELKERLKDVL